MTLKNWNLRMNCINSRIISVIFLFGLMTFINTPNAVPIADGASKFLGNISTAGPPSNYLNYWNQVTLENNGKWANVEATKGQFNWSNIQAAYDFCKKNKIPYKQHCFVWGEQYPSWMDNLSAADQKTEVENWIKSYGAKFPETDFIDVVNEAREKSPKWKTALGGAGTTGYDWIVWAFKMARKYCPKAKLLINEYFCEYDLNFVTEYLKMVKVLKDSSLIDGVGIQTHDGETKKGYDMGVLKKCIDSLATGGVDIYSTELDISGNDSVQLYYYKGIFPIIWDHPKIKGVTMWGWTDSWLLQLSTPKDGRLIINGTERPALKWIRDYVSSHKNVITGIRREQAVAAQPGIKLRRTRDELCMNLDKEQSVSVTVTTPNGRVVYVQAKRPLTKGEHALAFPVHAFGAGLYIATVHGDRATVTQKISF